MIANFAFSGPEFLLIAIFFFTSIWNTSVGPTGGVNFAATAIILSPGAAVPLQAMVEAVFGSYRLWLLRPFVDRIFLRQFIAGGIVGFAFGIGLRFVATPSDSMLQIVMGALILMTTWLPLAKVVAGRRSFPWSVGIVTSVLGLFVGGIAPLIASAAEKHDSEHRQVIATMSAGLLFHHSTKAALFGTFGFSFVGYAPLIIALILSGLIGTWIGRRLLFNLPQQVLGPAFKLLVTVLALNLLWRGTVA